MASSNTCAPTAPPDISSIQKVIRNVFRSSKIQVQQVQRLQGRVHQVFLTKLADGNSLVLKSPPAYTTRTLRHEKHGLENERKTLETLREYTQLSVPQVIKYDSKGGPSGSQFLLMSHIPGRRLSELALYLTPSERQAVDRMLGAYVRTLSSLSATQFGLTHRVFTKRGYSSWREAFLALLEAVLRDGEDMLVTIPYDSIRYYVARHAAYLDEVTQPRLVALDVCQQQNVLLHEQTRQVSGLVGFSNVIWGDPLMNGGIANGSDAFFEGFGERPSRTGGVVARQLM
jgi:aminoglycoside phosphotransferase (APT) family kinase protein